MDLICLETYSREGNEEHNQEITLGSVKMNEAFLAGLEMVKQWN
jgi:hypothetical protein